MKKIEIAILIIIALIIPLYVLWKNSFPAFDYYLNKSNNHGISIKKKEFDNKTFLMNPYYKNQPFSRVDLKVYFSDDFISKLDNPIIVSVYENYESLAYPKKGEITNAEELRGYLYYNNESSLPNGTLFSNGDSVFFVSQGEYRPILSSDIFKKLGFDWENLIPQETEIFSLLTEGEKVVFSSAHPNGVILKIKNELYLVWEEELIRIKDEELLREVWNEYYTVSASKFSSLDSCVFNSDKKKKFLNCSFSVSNSSEENQPYIFEFDQNNLSQNITEAQSRLKVSANVRDMKKSIMIFLLNLKGDLAGRYGEYFL